MVLGQLYTPTGLALETARAVLEEECVFACNTAWGCSGGCSYCYNKKFTNGKVRLPTEEPWRLVEKQLQKERQEGVFLSFGTDPFLHENNLSTNQLIRLFLAENLKVATLSKRGASRYSTETVDCERMRNGFTIVCLDNKFQKYQEQHEPRSIPIYQRINLLRGIHLWEGYTWVSMEPYPPPAIWKQNITELLEAISFVDFIIFGKWNYDVRSSTEEARSFYRETVPVFEDFCKSHAIRYHVKSDTRKFIQ